MENQANPNQQAPEAIQFDSKLEFLNQKYFFHDILKSSSSSKHYIVEDLEVDPNVNSASGFYYLKQTTYHHKGEYLNALKYYTRLQNYCKMPFAKTDIIRLHQIHNFDLEESNYFELVLIFDLGEPDRIDIDNIESQHITKFLKNVCLLLQDLKKFDQIYHGNIYIKNIVLVNNELKLSGFKPIYLDNPEYNTWKVDLARTYNHFRGDLYLIGLIWLRFLGANVESATAIGNPLTSVISQIDGIYSNLPDEKKMNIVTRLLDLKNHPDLTLEDVILDFDEFYILENIKNNEEEKKRLAESGINPIGEGFGFDDNNSLNDRFDSLGPLLKKSDSKETNPFMRPYKESERDLLVGFKAGDGISESKQDNNYLKIDGDFTLQDDDDSIMPNRLSKDELITIQDVQRIQSKSVLTNLDAKNPSAKKYESNGGLGNKINSEKHFTGNDSNEENNSMRKLKSTDGLINDSKNSLKNTQPVQKTKPKAPKATPEPDAFKKTKNSKPEEPRKKSAEKPLRKESPKKSAKQEQKPISEKKAVPKPQVFKKPQASNQNSLKILEEDKPSTFQMYKERKAMLLQKAREEPELTPEQRMKIQKAVEEDLARLSNEDYEKYQRAKETAEKRMEEQKSQEVVLKEKLDKIAAENVLKKKENLMNEIRARRQYNAEQDQEVEAAYARVQEKHRQLEKNRDLSPHIIKDYLKSNSKENAEDKDFVNLPSGKQTQNLPLKSTQRSLFEDINKRAKRDFEISSFNQRDNLFSYDRELEVKNIGYKKLAINPDKYIKTEGMKLSQTLKTVFKTLEQPSNAENNEVAEPQAEGDKHENSFNIALPENEEVKHSAPSFAKLANEADNDVPELKATGNNSQISLAGKKSQNASLQNSMLKLQDDKSQKHSVTPIRRSLSRKSHSPTNKSQSRLAPDDHSLAKDNQLNDSVFNIEEKPSDPTGDNKAYLKAVNEAKNLVNAKELEKAISVLLGAKDNQKGSRRIEIIKMLAALYRKANKPEKTKDVLLQGLEYLKSSPDMASKEEVFRQIVLDLILLEIENKEYQEAVSLLVNPVFQDQSKLPANYHGLLGECQLMLGNPKEALVNFEKQLERILSRELGLENIAPLFNLINKILLAQQELNNQVAIAKFYSKMVAVLARVNKVNSSLKFHENDFHNLLEQLSLNVLNFAWDRENYNLMNYVLNEIVGKSLLDFVNNMNEEERVNLCDLTVGFCAYIKKLPNYGGFKSNYIKYLTYAKDIVKNCDLTNKNLKTNLLINFNRGVFNLQEQNYEKAQKLFDKCLEVYYAFFNEPDRELYSILYNIGLGLYRQKKHANSVYFFNKMLDLNCQDPLLKEKAIKYLGKIYFRLGEFTKCTAILGPFIRDHFEGKSVINYYRYLSFFYLSLGKLKSDEFEGYIEKLRQEQVKSPNPERAHYLSAYTSLNNIMGLHHNYKENDKYVALLQELVAEKGQDNKLKSARLANIISFIHERFVQKSDGDNSNKGLIQALKDRLLTIEENTEATKDFLINFITMLVNKLPLYNERVKNHAFRQSLLDDIRGIIDKTALRRFIHELIHGAAGLRGAESQAVLNQTSNTAGGKQAKVFATDSALKKTESEQGLQNSAPKGSHCTDAGEAAGNPELNALIASFLKQIKNMLFLDVTANVEHYYNRFESALSEKGVSVDKYNYIKKLIKYHLLRANGQKLDRVKFTRMLDELVEGGNLNVQDFKLILLIFESFKDIEYLQLFTAYLDTYHPDLALVVFQQVYLDSFEKRYQRVIDELYGKINGFRFHQLENFPLVHYLESENLLNLEKELTFQIFTRMRYDVLYDEKFHAIFTKYLDISDLQMFYVKYNTYLAIVTAVKQPHLSSVANLRNFQKSLYANVLNYQIEEIHSRYYSYDLLVLVHLLNFKPNEDLATTIFEILAFVEDRLPQYLSFHFSVVCSAIGSIFFKHRLLDAALKAKHSSLDLLEKSGEADTEMPLAMRGEDPESHRFQLLAFIYIIEIELQHKEESVEAFKQIEEMELELALNELTRKLLKALNFYQDNIPKKGKKELRAAEELFNKMNLKDITEEIFRAAMDKLALMCANKVDNPEEIANRKRISEGSISRLYRPLI